MKVSIILDLDFSSTELGRADVQKGHNTMNTVILAVCNAFRPLP